MMSTGPTMPADSGSPEWQASLAFAAAPHRLLFLTGTLQVLLAMVWWSAWLVSVRWHGFELPTPAIPAGWLHAFVMQYQMLPPFFFGFLLTVFPRWMNLPPLSRRHYLPVGACLIGGQLVTLFGMASITTLRAGVLLTLAGWAWGVFLLARLAISEAGRSWHARSCLAALGMGLLGLLFFLRFLSVFDARWLFAAVQMGSTVVLLPVFLTVCHRMIPFFAGAVIRGYQTVRPMWVLGAAWGLLLLHTVLVLLHDYQWSWVADAPLTFITGWLLWRWWNPAALRIPLLLVLFAGFAWLPVAMALHTLQSVAFVITGQFMLGRAPLHALFVGCFGSLLVAMVTRVTQGHSGRPLTLGRIPALCFLLLQGVAVLRILSELLPDSGLWQALAAIGWVVAFAPWVLRSAWIYLTPRTDGAPG